MAREGTPGIDRPSLRELSCRRCGKWMDQRDDMRWYHQHDGRVGCVDPVTLLPYEPAPGADVHPLANRATVHATSSQIGSAAHPKEHTMTSTKSISIDLATAKPAELRAECDRLGVEYRAKDDRQRLVNKLRKAVPATAAVEQPAEPVATPASDDPAERLRLAKAEHKLLKEWAANGENPPRPETPNLDAMNAEYEARGGKPAPKRSKRTSAGVAEPSRPSAGLRFVINGRPVPDTQNKLSSAAYRAKISTAELRQLIGTVSQQPFSEPWTVTTTEGRTVELRRDDEPAAAAS